MKSKTHKYTITTYFSYLVITTSLFCNLLISATPPSTPIEMSNAYASIAKAENPGFRSFSVSAGKLFFHKERIQADGKSVSCATCHTPDPRNKGTTRANKVIEPLAPSANTERFTDYAKVEKWFARNCKDVLDRPCTTQEKGDFIEYLRSVQ